MALTISGYAHEDYTDQSPEATATRKEWLSIVAHLCLFTGTNTITSKNIVEVWRRFNLWETIGGAVAGDIAGPVSQATLRAYIGARTNVPDEPKAKFDKRAAGFALDVAMRKTMPWSSNPALIDLNTPSQRRND